jgi:hypothetical protein
MPSSLASSKVVDFVCDDTTSCYLCLRYMYMSNSGGAGLAKTSVII